MQELIVGLSPKHQEIGYLDVEFDQAPLHVEALQQDLSCGHDCLRQLEQYASFLNDLTSVYAELCLLLHGNTILPVAKEKCLKTISRLLKPLEIFYRLLIPSCSFKEAQAW